MRTSVATLELCLPITALDNVLLGQRRLLLAGQGPYLHVYDIESNHRLLSTRIFEVQAIHGICHGAARSQDDNDVCLPIAIIGGSSVLIALLEVGDMVAAHIECRVSKERVCDATEWILKVHHMSQALSHGFALLTTNNCLYTLTGSAQHASGSVLDVLARGPKSSLYSGDISAYSRDHMLVAGGSVYGEVIIWTCKKSDLSSQWEAHAKYSFQGHRGSVFGTCISPRLSSQAGSRRFVASCSDDRTIQVWDVSGHESRSGGDSVFDQRTDTGFGPQMATSSDRLALASGHVSRIWAVDFVVESASPDCTQDEVHLISRGEDATCHVWSLGLARIGTDAADSRALQFVSADHHHAGKSTLAWTQYADGSSTILISGGADGRIVKRPLQLFDCQRNSVQTQPFRDICIHQNSTTLKDYLVLDMKRVVATTASGLLLKCEKVPGACGKWHTEPVSTLTPVTKLCSNSLENVVISATRNGMLVSLHGDPFIYVPLQLVQLISRMWLVSVTMVDHHWHDVLVVVTFPNPQSTMLVRINTAYLEYKQETVTLDVPNKFTVTSACYARELDLLVLGSRTGSLVIRPGTRQDSTCSQTEYDVNGSHAVTSLQIMPGSDSYPVHVLSTGRDGTFAIYAVWTDGLTRERSLFTLYKSSPQCGMNIEGAILSTPSSFKQPELILFGFQSTSFVVWNHSKQAQMLSIDCGGAHRSWGYHMSLDTEEHAFVWTKASTFNSLRSPLHTLDILREGSHGREIKALAVRPGFHVQGNRPRMIATGAEDTTIRLCSFQSSTPRSDCSQGAHGLKPLVTLIEHTTGVQHLAFSSCGDYLFSSGGSGELFAWSVLDNVPIVGLGVTLREKLIQSSDDSDARILDFDVLDRDDAVAVEQLGPAGPTRLVVAYSNGKVRIVDYTPGSSSGTNSFTPKMVIFYGSFCLTQVHVRPSSTNTFMTILAAGTNGYLYADDLHTTPSNRSARRIHQSSIMSMDCIDLGIRRLIATGGDDNTLALTLLEPTENLRTMLIPKAHAAALTALKIVHHEQCLWGHAAVILTVGNDQRVKAWGIKWHTSGGLSDHQLQITLLQEAWTSVADVSNIEVLGSVRENVLGLEFDVVIVGVGMEVLQINLDEVAKPEKGRGV